MASQVKPRSADAFFKEFKGPKSNARTPLAKESEKRKAEKVEYAGTWIACMSLGLKEAASESVKAQGQLSRRLQTLRTVHGKANCDHTDVLIRSILKPYSSRTRSRTIGGRCQMCTRDVSRVMTEVEIKSGIQQTGWTTTP